MDNFKRIRELREKTTLPRKELQILLETMTQEDENALYESARQVRESHYAITVKMTASTAAYGDQIKMRSGTGSQMRRSWTAVKKGISSASGRSSCREERILFIQTRGFVPLFPGSGKDILTVR